MDRIDSLRYYLQLWAVWMAGKSSRLGYPRKSMVLESGSGGYGQDWEDWADDQDYLAAILTDAAIESLDLPQQSSIHHCWLHAVFRFPRLDLEQVYADALETLRVELRRRGLE